MKVKIKVANPMEHNKIVKVAKQSKYTSAFSNMIFSGEDCYQQQRIRVATLKDQVVGFYCIRNRKRDGVTVLYFVGVDTKHRNKGIGLQLMNNLHKVSTGTVELKVMKDNPAVRLYERLGYRIVGEAYKGEAHLMLWQRETSK